MRKLHLAAPLLIFYPQRGIYVKHFQVDFEKCYPWNNYCNYYFGFLLVAALVLALAVEFLSGALAFEVALAFFAGEAFAGFLAVALAGDFAVLATAFLAGFGAKAFTNNTALYAALSFFILNNIFGCLEGHFPLFLRPQARNVFDRFF